MATYPVINKETGEKKEVIRYVMNGISGVKIIQTGQGIDSRYPGVWVVENLVDLGEVTNPGWNDVLRKASKQPGATFEPRLPL